MSESFQVGVQFDLDLSKADGELDKAERQLKDQLGKAVETVETKAKDLGVGFEDAGRKGSKAFKDVGDEATKSAARVENANKQARNDMGQFVVETGRFQGILGKVLTSVSGVGESFSTAFHRAKGDITPTRDELGRFIAETDRGHERWAAFGANVRSVASNIVSGFASATEHVGRFSLSVGSITTSALSSVAEIAGKGALSLAGMALNVGKLATVIGGGVLATLTGIGIKTAASLEQAQTGFNSLLGSKEAGSAFFKDLIQLANVSAFEVGQIVGPAQTLLAVYKGDAPAAVSALNTLGNATALLGKNSPEVLERLAGGFGKMASQGKVSMESLNIIAEALPGFNARLAIATGYVEAHGGTTEHAMDLISKGGITAAEGTDLLLQKLNEFPGLATAMADQAQTLGGVLSTFSDTFKSSLAFDLAAPLIQPIKDALNQITPTIGTALQGLGQRIAPIAATLLPAFTAGFTPVLNALPALFGNFGAGYGAIFTALAPLGQQLADTLTPISESIGQLLSELAPEIASLASTALKFLPVVEGVFLVLGPLLSALTPGINAFAGTFLDALAKLAEPLALIARLVGEGISKALVSLAPLIGPIFGTLLAVLIPVAQAFSNVVQVAAPFVEQIVKGLLPALPPLAAVFVDLVNAVLPLIPPIATLVGVIAGGLYQAFTTLAPVILPVINTLSDLALQILPIVGEVAGTLITSLVALVTGLAPVFDALSGALNAILPAILDMVQAFLPLLPILVDLALQLVPVLVETLQILAPVLVILAKALGVVFDWLAKHETIFKILVVAVIALSNPVLLLVGAFGALAAGLKYAYDHVGWFHSAVDAVARFLSGPFFDVIQSIGRFFQSPLDHLKALGDTVLGFFQSLPGLALSGLETLGGVIGDAITAALNTAKDLLLAFAGSAVDFLVSLPVNLIQGMVNLAAVLITFFTTTLPLAAAQVIEWVADADEWLVELPGNLIAGAVELAPRLVSFLVASVARGTETVAGWVATAATFLAELPGNLIAGAADLGGRLFSWLGEELPKAAKQIATWVESAGSFLIDLPEKLIGGIVDLGGKLGKALYDAFKSAWNYLADNFKINIPSFELFGKEIGGGTVGLPHLARGALYDRATTAVIGEAGKEFALPVNDPAAVRSLASRYPTEAATVASALLQGIPTAAGTPGGGTAGAGATHLDASVHIGGNVYGVADLDRYLDERDRTLAALIGAR